MGRQPRPGLRAGWGVLDEGTELGGQRGHSAWPQAGILVWERLSCPAAGGGRPPAVSGMPAWRHARCLDSLPEFSGGETELRSAFQTRGLPYEAGQASDRQAGGVGGGHFEGPTGPLPLPAFVLPCVAPQKPCPEVGPFPKPRRRFSDQRWEWGAEGTSLCPGPSQRTHKGTLWFCSGCGIGGREVSVRTAPPTDKPGLRSAVRLPRRVRARCPLLREVVAGRVSVRQAVLPPTPEPCSSSLGFTRLPGRWPPNAGGHGCGLHGGRRLPNPALIISPARALSQHDRGILSGGRVGDGEAGRALAASSTEWAEQHRVGRCFSVLLGPASPDRDFRAHFPRAGSCQGRRAQQQGTVQGWGSVLCSGQLGPRTREGSGRALGGVRSIRSQGYGGMTCREEAIGTGLVVLPCGHS